MAEKLQGEGAMVFTIGVGTAAGSEIQVYNEQGQLMLLRDNRGQVVRSRLDEETLQRIARLTKGNYYPLGPLGEGLAKVRIAADSLATGPGSAPASKLGLDRFHWPVGITLTLLIMESLIGTRRRLRESRLVA
jgi:Ca-activated chloride channel family protein